MLKSCKVMKFEIAAKYDVVIIGSGISGLLCALELSKQKLNVCIVTKEAVTESSSLYAQGGIAVPLSKSDSVEKHLQDTLNAGAGLCDEIVAREIISSSEIALEQLISYGVKFDLTREENIHQTKEAAHSFARVCHVGGDASGRFITKTLIEKACREPNISISQGSFVLGIFKNDDNNANHVLVEDVAKNKYILSGRDIIIATGGIGQLYEQTTNPLVSTGDGIAMAYRNGADLQDIEMIQFHPTVLLEHGDPFLITEAIRGEGAKIKNVHGEYFAKKYHELAELAPRDVLARAILNEIEKSKSRFVYLDISSFDHRYFKTRFPTVFKTCEERKIDLFNTGIPVAPAAHYFIGGVRCDVNGKTSVPSLWVVGEAGANSFHGANRLASNSLLECIVVPCFLVKNLLTGNFVPFVKTDYAYIDVDKNNYDEVELLEIKKTLKAKNSLALGLTRDEKTLKEHLNWLSDLKDKINVDTLSVNPQAQELKNMILLSFLICQAAIMRKHSLGVHYRQDFPDKPQEFKHSLFNQNMQLLKLSR